MKKTKCWLKRKLPGRKVYQNDDSFQESDSASLPGGIWTQVAQGNRKYIMANSLLPQTCTGHINEVFPSWFSVISAQIALVGSWPPARAHDVANKWLNQWKREKSGCSQVWLLCKYLRYVRGPSVFGCWFLIQKANLFCRYLYCMASAYCPVINVLNK